MLRLYHADGHSNAHGQPTRLREDAACCKLVVQISFAEMVLKGHGFSASGAVPSAQTWNRASAPAPFPNLERVPQRLKPDFRPVLTARLRSAEAVPLQNLRKPRNTPASLDSLAACCASTGNDKTPGSPQAHSGGVAGVPAFHAVSYRERRG